MGEPFAPSTELRNLQEQQKFRLQSLKPKGKIGRVRVQRRNLRGKGEEKRDVGAGGLGRIGGRADTRQQWRDRRNPRGYLSNI